MSFLQRQDTPHVPPEMLWPGHCADDSYYTLPAIRFSLASLVFFLSVFARYDHEPHCRYNHNKLNFAVHVRLGDRVQFLTDTESVYLEYLERFMDHVTESVVLRGLDPPMFHIFSETANPCPSTVNGTFAEFPSWPVEMEQVRTAWE